MKFEKILQLFFSILLCQTAGIIGSVFTAKTVSTWYLTLEKPAFSPPNWLFGPVWLTLYTIMGISFFLIWTSQEKAHLRYLNFFIVHLALNAVWSIIFFGYQQTFMAFIILILLWIMILFLIIGFWKVSRLAGLLLIPYLAWVSFAGLLNFQIWILNS